MLHWYHRTKGSGLESHLLLPKHQDESRNHEPVPSLVQGPASQARGKLYHFQVVRELKPLNSSLPVS